MRARPGPVGVPLLDPAQEAGVLDERLGGPAGQMRAGLRLMRMPDGLSY